MTKSLIESLGISKKTQIWDFLTLVILLITFLLPDSNFENFSLIIITSFLVILTSIHTFFTKKTFILFLSSTISLISIYINFNKYFILNENIIILIILSIIALMIYFIYELFNLIWKNNIFKIKKNWKNIKLNKKIVKRTHYLIISLITFHLFLFLFELFILENTILSIHQIGITILFILLYISYFLNIRNKKKLKFKFIRFRISIFILFIIFDILLEFYRIQDGGKQNPAIIFLIIIYISAIKNSHLEHKNFKTKK